MKKFILFYVLACSAFAFGQIDAVPTNNDAKANVTLGARNSMVGDMSYINGAGAWLPGRPIDNTIEGTPHLFSSWDGLFEIFVTENKGFRVLNLNYNISTKRLESKIDNDSVFQFDTAKISFINRKSEKYKFYDIKGSKELYKVIYSSDKVIFLKGYAIEITKGRINPMTQEVISKSKYLTKERFVANINNAGFVEVDMKKKPILKLMGDKSGQVEKFASDSKLSFNSEADLFKVFQYYDSL